MAGIGATSPSNSVNLDTRFLASFLWTVSLTSSQMMAMRLSCSSASFFIASINSIMVRPPLSQATVCEGSSGAVLFFRLPPPPAFAPLLPSALPAGCP
eukprot:CAMPEP_0174949164 /NCGR_PEP_ID=MMETSP1355-20121228/90849_1 /TAXON_ID=464990 /ORGANISM="Hemiselmis tepida, Strain CCMP443" /LENGTH=97 /DNA_ID=CAMNT_0016196709 /DNA_START=89 /DNA_END=378 /DNA_ORIENTATION=+